jgi:hypothetical protein
MVFTLSFNFKAYNIEMCFLGGDLHLHNITFYNEIQFADQMLLLFLLHY